MAVITRLDDDDLQAIADKVLRQKLSGIGFDGIVARAGLDHDGDPAVFVCVNMPSGSAIIPAGLLADARVALAKALASRGDESLAYLSVDWPGDEAPPSSDVPT